MHSHSILLAGLAGFFCALVFSSVPVGPINLTILNEGARRGFTWALLIGLGAAVMEVVYCSIAFTGFSTFLDHTAVRATLQVGSFVFLVFGLQIHAGPIGERTNQPGPGLSPAGGQIG
jgi:threonine/homoserine/homoserine lactone efflux protein